MNGTTSISALPNDATQNKVVLNVEPMTDKSQGPPPMAPPPQQNQLLPQGQAKPQQQPAMQQMSSENANVITAALSNQGVPTSLPNRDVQMNMQQQQDLQQFPNYIPESEMDDYIENDDTLYNMMNKGKTEEKEQDRLDQIYEELQIPIMVMVLFFLFQMPFVRKHMKRLLPSLFSKDNNPTFGGYLLKTAMFGGSFYGIMKLTKYLSEM